MDTESLWSVDHHGKWKPSRARVEASLQSLACGGRVSSRSSIALTESALSQHSCYTGRSQSAAPPEFRGGGSDASYASYPESSVVSAAFVCRQGALSPRRSRGSGASSMCSLLGGGQSEVYGRSQSAAPEHRRSERSEAASYDARSDASFCASNFDDAANAAGSRSHRARGKIDWANRYHTPATQKPEVRRDDSNPISHTHAPTQAKPKKVMNCGASSDAAGHVDPAARRASLTGNEDMLPAATRSQLITDLPPSEELVRHNELRAHTSAKTQRPYTKADLPPSDEYKKRNEVHSQPSRGPRKHTAGDMSPSSELMNMNERNLLTGAHRENIRRNSNLYDHGYSSHDVKSCLVPPRNCAMSDSFADSFAAAPPKNGDASCRSSVIGDNVSTRVSQLSSIPEHHPRSIHERRNGGNSAASDVSSFSGIAGRHRELGSEAGDNFDDNASMCSRSAADSMCSRSAPGSTAFAPPPARTPRSRGGGGVGSKTSRASCISEAPSSRSSSTAVSSTASGIPLGGARSLASSVVSRDKSQSASSSQMGGISQGAFSMMARGRQMA